MHRRTSDVYKNICPLNCPSSCSIITHYSNGKITHIEADPYHPYTEGKLCAKGFSFIEQNYHEDRLKYPLYQKVKGSGNFKKITWDKAYQLIITELIKINNEYKSMLPFALFKSTGNIGLLNKATEQFFHNIGPATIIQGATSFLNKVNKFNFQKSNVNNFTAVKDSKLIILWGANPAVSNIHLIPQLINAKMKGAKIVVIDPLYSQTANMADLFVNLRPNSDQILAYFLLQKLIPLYKDKFATLKNVVPDFTQFYNVIKQLSINDVINNCDIQKQVFHKLLQLLIDTPSISFIVGTGILKHGNSHANLKAIDTLISIVDLLKDNHVNLVYRRHNQLVENKTQTEAKGSMRSINVNKLNFSQTKHQDDPIEFLWISCANPLNQEVNPQSLRKVMENIPFVVTVDKFLTDTALMSNLVLPTTTLFEKNDVILNNYHCAILYNEQASQPFYESKSDWLIFTELSKMLQETTKIECNFPIFNSDKDYLQSLYNEQIKNNYNIDSFKQLKDKTFATIKVNYDNQFEITDLRLPDFSELNNQLEQLRSNIPKEQYPFWLITAHHPYMLNSQFHYLNISDEGEAAVYMNSSKAKQLHIVDGEIITIYNNHSSLQIKVVLTPTIAQDILLIYQGWYPETNIIINQLISKWQYTYGKPDSTNHLYSFYDTFVNIKKL